MNSTQNPETPSQPLNAEPNPTPVPYLQLSVSGLFMGLANLVPGVSGGTMILVLGMYDEFISAFSDVTRLKITLRSILVLGILFGVAAFTVFGLASLIQFLMESFMPGMLGLFIGMTLGGAPLLYREIRPLKADTLVPAILAIILMALLAFVFRIDFSRPGFLLYFMGGVVGSAAMILPGISGSYILLILGLYLPIIRGISQFKDALSSRDLDAILALGTGLVLPVGLGLVIGLAVLTNMLKFLLQRYHRPTIGFLLGLLLGSVFGLYPFQEARFDKLPRYAVDGTLHIVGLGWDATNDWVVYRNLQSLESEGYFLNLIEIDPEGQLDEDHIELAGSVNGLVIVYDESVSNQLRTLAERMEPNNVHIEVVPNTEFTPAKAAIVLVLIVAGFAITFALGRLDPKRRKQKEQA